MKGLLADAAIAECARFGMPVAVAVEQIAFTSPSRNIGCFMDPWTVRCDIRDRNWSPPPRPANCPEFGDYGQDYGQGIAQRRQRPGPAVSYGQETQLEPIRCQIWPNSSCSDFINGTGLFDVP